MRTAISSQENWIVTTAARHYATINRRGLSTRRCLSEASPAPIALHRNWHGTATAGVAFDLSHFSLKPSRTRFASDALALPVSGLDETSGSA